MRMSTTTQLKHILIGTAGHIDHGKTRLVERLTSINTDRLPEEQARGISIDLGFAHWEADGNQFGIVDVPGHERFVKNMVAGATGVNIALLVIAADDSVMPQTREHLEIMDLLGVSTGVIAITKIDLVDPDYVDLVESEIEETVAGTFLEGCPIVPVSSATGAGVDELQAMLVRLAEGIETPANFSLFRMPIDRVFSIAGHGTVVTGSVISGDVHAGETLELWPGQRDVRVRSVQNHGHQAESSSARQRTAINLAGVRTDDVIRGMELATPGYLQSAQRMLVSLRTLASSPITLKDRLEFSLHLGTAEVPARVILKGQRLKPGEQGYAELRLLEPAVAAYGQHFILRRISPALTVAGGTILDPGIPPAKRLRDPQLVGEALAASAPETRLSQFLSQKNNLENLSLEAAWRVGIDPRKYEDLFDDLRKEGVLLQIGNKDRALLIHKDRLTALAGSVLRTIREQLAKHQPRRALPRNTLLTACKPIVSGPLLEAVIDHLVQTKDLVRIGTHLGPRDAQVKLTKNQEAARTHILQRMAATGLTPPTAKELAGEVNQKLDQIEMLLHLCAEDGLLVRIADGLYFSPEALETARQVCETLLADAGQATMAELRDAWGVTRKYSIPLCEYFDALEVTTRQGDVRIAGKSLDVPLET